MRRAVLALVLVLAGVPVTVEAETAAARLAAASLSAGPHDVRIDDITVHYEVSGSGPPLILLHGGWSSVEQWVPLLPMLDDTFTVIRMDSRGRGRSGDSDAPISYDRMAKDVVGLMDHLGIRRARIAGHSEGGVIALHMLINYSGRVENAVLSGLAANIEQDGLSGQVATYADLADQLKRGTPSPQLAAFRDRWMETTPEPARFEEVVSKLGHTWSTTPAYTADELRSIHRSVCILRAGNDGLIPVAAYDRMHAAISTSVLVDVPGGTHRIVHEEAPLYAKTIISCRGTP